MARTSSAKIMEKLIENNILLQHKIVDLVDSIKELSKKVDSLVTLFKEAGEHIKTGKYEDPLLHKLDSLLEQNKNLIKAISMLEKYVKERESVSILPKPLKTE